MAQMRGGARRGGLFDPPEVMGGAGAGATSSSARTGSGAYLDPEAQERANYQEIAGIGERVAMLKGLTGSLHAEVKEQVDFLDTVVRVCRPHHLLMYVEIRIAVPIGIECVPQHTLAMPVVVFRIICYD